MERPVHAMGAGVGVAGVGGVPPPVFFPVNVRRRRLGTDAASSGMASITEAAAAAAK